MLENKQTAVDAVAAEAKQLIDALFAKHQAPRVPVDVEEEPMEEKKTLTFDLAKDGEFNYDFIVSNRVSPATMHSYLDVVNEVMSICPNLSEQTTRLIVNVFANHLDISASMVGENFATQIGGILNQASASVSHDYMIMVGKVFNSPETFKQLTKEVDEQIQIMMTSGSMQDRITAMGFRELADGERIFAYLMNKFTRMQIDFLGRQYGHISPPNHVKSMFQLNRLARIVCEVLCILYAKEANK